MKCLLEFAEWAGALSSPPVAKILFLVTKVKSSDGWFFFFLSMLFVMNWKLDMHACPAALLAEWTCWYYLLLCIFSSSHSWYWIFHLQVVQQPSGAIVKQVSTLPQPSTLTLQTSAEKRMPLNTLVQTNKFPAGMVVPLLWKCRNKYRLLVDCRKVAVCREKHFYINFT